MRNMASNTFRLGHERQDSLPSDQLDGVTAYRAPYVHALLGTVLSSTSGTVHEIAPQKQYLCCRILGHIL